LPDNHFDIHNKYFLLTEIYFNNNINLFFCVSLTL
jgi:hypothetical protein